MDGTEELLMDTLPLQLKGFLPEKSRFQVACFVWCMRELNKESGCELSVFEGNEGKDAGRSVIKRKRPDQVYKLTFDSSAFNEYRTSICSDEAIELGAEAIALALAIRSSNYDYVERAEKMDGGGFDYWLCKGDQLFGDRLEVSGILKDEHNFKRLKERLKLKLQQASNSDAIHPGTRRCVTVVEFSRPVATMVWDNEDA